MFLCFLVLYLKITSLNSLQLPNIVTKVRILVFIKWSYKLGPPYHVDNYNLEWLTYFDTLTHFQRIWNMQLVQDDQQLQIVHVVICLMIFIWFVLHKMVNDQRGQIMREVDMSFPRCGCVWHGGVWDAPFYECPMVQWVWGSGASILSYGTSNVEGSLVAHFLNQTPKFDWFVVR